MLAGVAQRFRLQQASKTMPPSDAPIAAGLCPVCFSSSAATRFHILREILEGISAVMPPRHESP